MIDSYYIILSDPVDCLKVIVGNHIVHSNIIVDDGLKINNNNS